MAIDGIVVVIVGVQRGSISLFDGECGRRIKRRRVIDTLETLSDASTEIDEDIYTKDYRRIPLQFLSTRLEILRSQIK